MPFMPSEGDPRRWVLQVPNQIPDEERPFGGIFTEAHIHSVLPYCHDLAVYYAYTLNAPAVNQVQAREELLVKPKKDDLGYRKIVRRYKRRTGWQFRGMIDFLRWTYGNRKQIRLIHAHGTVWAGLWSIVAGKLFGIPVVLSEYSSGFAGVPVYPRMLRRVFPWLLPHCDAMFPVTDNLGSFIRRYAPNVPQHAVPNCVETDLFRPGPFPPDDEFRILFIGTIEPIKRVDMILRACARLHSRVPLRLCLGGPGPLLEKMQGLADELGIGSRTEFLGYIGRDRVKKELTRCHVLVLASEWETQGRVLIEAMLSGRPVVAPRVGGIPETVPEHAGILFTAGNEDELTAALESTYRKLSSLDPQAIAAGCRDRFSYEAVGRRLADLYERYARCC